MKRNIENARSIMGIRPKKSIYIENIVLEALNKFLISEGIENEDYPLYHNTSIMGLNSILSQDMLISRLNMGEKDREQAICFSRISSFKALHTVVGAVIVFKPKAFVGERGLKLVNYDWQIENGNVKNSADDEYEERLVSKNGRKFCVSNLHNKIQEIHVNLKAVLKDTNSSIEFKNNLLNIFGNCQEYLQIMYFHFDDKSFYKLNKNEGLSYQQVLSNYKEIYKNLVNPELYNDEKRIDNALTHANEMDMKDDPIYQFIAFNDNKNGSNFYKDIYFSLMYGNKKWKISNCKNAVIRFLKGIINKGDIYDLRCALYDIYNIFPCDDIYYDEANDIIVDNNI